MLDSEYLHQILNFYPPSIRLLGRKTLFLRWQWVLLLLLMLLLLNIIIVIII